MLLHCFELFGTLVSALLKHFHFVSEIFDSDLVALYLVLHNLNSGISNLIAHQELMELCKVGVRLEYIQQIERHIQIILELLSKCS